MIGKRCKLPGQGADIGAFESDDIVRGALSPKPSVRVSLTMSRKDIVHEISQAVGSRPPCPTSGDFRQVTSNMRAPLACSDAKVRIDTISRCACARDATRELRI